eukprot:Skav209089  [mRNA]  locus=scaffold207:834170:836756:- [translate_table: standard]
MEVCSAISGETVACLNPADVEGKSVKEVKRMLANEMLVPRFRQRLFVEDGSVELGDYEIVTCVPIKVQLVLLEFVHSGKVDPEMIAASEANDSVALEQLLQIPINPNFKDLNGWAPLHYAARHGHENPPEGYFRLGAIGSEVKLRHSYVPRLEGDGRP